MGNKCGITIESKQGAWDDYYICGRPAKYTYEAYTPRNTPLGTKYVCGIHRRSSDIVLEKLGKPKCTKVTIGK